MFYGTFSFYPGQPKDIQMPTSDKVPLLNRYRKIGKIFCNDFRCKSLICRSLTIGINYYSNDLNCSFYGVSDFDEKKYVGGDVYNYIISASRSSAVMIKNLK